jgi:hypothetical protein
MVNFKTFQFSCELIGGYRCNIDLDDCKSLDDILQMSVSLLKSFLLTNNLYFLLEKVESFKYHIHDLFEDILNKETPSDNIHGYICNHCEH